MRIKLLAVVVSGLFLLPAIAKADTFTFSSVGSGGGFSGSGVLTASDNGNGSYTLTAITGPGIDGLILVNGFFGNDNLLFPSASRLVDVNGFAFNYALAGQTIAVNIFSNLTGYEALTLDSDGNFDDTPVSFTISKGIAATPEPASILLLSSGILGVVTTHLKRRRSL